MRPQGNGIIELHDTKQKERGFVCMKLITFLTEDGLTEWEQWHGAHLQASVGQCPYSQDCPIYRQTLKKRGAIQLSIQFD